LGENLASVKISDISELMAPQEYPKILGNQLVHGSSSLLRDSVKNSDSSSGGWQERAHNGGPGVIDGKFTLRPRLPKKDGKQ